jgi:putative spermidine/putrescine transport system permease protein
VKVDTPATPLRASRRVLGYSVPYGLSLPSFVLFGLFIIAPLISVILTSLQQSTAFPDSKQGNYLRVLSDSFYRGILYNTIETGVLTTVITLILAYPLALYIAFSDDRSRRFVMLGVLSPLFIAIVVRAYALSLGLGPGSPVDRVDPGFNLLFTREAVIIGLVYTMLPYMIMSLSVSMTAVDRRVLSASDSLGVSFFYTLRRVLVPLSMPGIAAGSVLVCTLSMASLIVPIELGGSGYQVWMWQVYQQILVVADWPSGFSMGIILFVLIAVVLGIGQLFLLPRRRTSK